MKIMHGLHQILLITGIYLISCSAPIFSQQYLQEHTIWKQHFYFTWFPNGITDDDYTLELKGDTIINNKVYFKVLKSGVSREGTPYESPIYEFISPIREEDQKFYTYNLNLEQEFLLHDFDLEVGDTAITHADCDNNIVVSIDTVYLGNIPRKRFHLSGGYNFVKLIEGVGSTRGLEWQPCNDSPAPVFLQCFVQGDDYIQFNSPYPFDCSNLTVVSTEDVSDHQFTLYPNPFTAEINIQIPLTFEKPITVTFTSMLGTIIHREQIEVPKGNETINIGNIPSGFYLLWLSSNDGIRSFRIFKQ